MFQSLHAAHASELYNMNDSVASFRLIPILPA